MINLLRALKAGTTLRFPQSDDLDVTTLLYFLDHHGLIEVTVEDNILISKILPEKLEAFSPQRILEIFQQEDPHANTVILQSPKMSLDIFEDIPQQALPSVPGAFCGVSFGITKSFTFSSRGDDVITEKKGRRNGGTHYVALSPKDFIVWIRYDGIPVMAIYGVPTISSMLR